MKVNLEGIPGKSRSFPDVEEGNVYRTQKKIYVIIAVKEKPDSACGDSAIALSIDNDGNIEGAVSYSTYYFSRQMLVGKATNLCDIEIDWF